MGSTRHLLSLLFFSLMVAAPYAIQGARIQALLPHQREIHLQGGSDMRRVMIGSTAPTCTYNECRRCKYKCRAEQVPVEGDDPINSAYHYRCVCHRY